MDYFQFQALKHIALTAGGHRDILFNVCNKSEDDCMTTMITARVDSQKRKTAEKVFFRSTAHLSCVCDREED